MLRIGFPVLRKALSDKPRNTGETEGKASSPSWTGAGSRLSAPGRPWLQMHFPPRHQRCVHRPGAAGGCRYRAPVMCTAGSCRSPAASVCHEMEDPTVRHVLWHGEIISLRKAKPGGDSRRQGSRQRAGPAAAGPGGAVKPRRLPPPGPPSTGAVLTWKQKIK